MPQSLGSSGGHIGLGIALVLEIPAVAEAEAEDEVAFAWVVANAPVRARAMTKARTMFFMVFLPFWYSDFWVTVVIFWTTSIEQQ